MMKLRPGEIVGSDSCSGTAARLGMFLHRKYSSQLYAVTSSHAVAWQSSVRTLNQHDDQYDIGIRVAPTRFSSNSESITKFAALVRLNPNVSAEADGGLIFGRPFEILGEQVKLLHEQHLGAIGRVVAIQVMVEIPDEDMRPKFYTDAIRVQFDDSCPKEFLELRGAGSIFVTLDGKVAGMLIGLSSSRHAILSPLHHLEIDEDLALPKSNQLMGRVTGEVHDPAQQLLQRCLNEPSHISRIVAEFRSRTHCYFTHLSRCFSGSEMESYQNELVHTLYRIVGFKAFAAALQRLDLHSDAPYYDENDNWLWRASVERLKLIRVSEDGRRLEASENNALWASIGEMGDVVFKSTETVASPSLISQISEDHAHLADECFGANKIRLTWSDEEEEEELV